jgi:uncharacterized protein
MRVAATWGQSFWGRDLVTVEWRKLCFVTFSVEPALLATRLPPGLSLELLGDRALVNLVFWQAHYPSVLGFKPPHPLSSTELALRYLVREGPRRGVVTLQEDSSSAAVAIAARSLFREPTRHTQLSSREESGAEALSVEYQAQFRGRTQRVRVRASARASDPASDSFAHLVTHRPFAYSRSQEGTLRRFDLEHEPWREYAVADFEVDVDFAALYGPEWGALTGATPTAVILSEGSPVRASLPE